MKITRVRFPVLFILLILLVILVPVFVRNPAALHVLILTMLYAYLATSWNIIGGIGGQLSFAHAVFTGIGAYTSSVLLIYYGVSPWIGMLAGAFFASILAVLMGLPTFRLRGAYFALASIALASTFQTVLTIVDRIGNIRLWGAQGLILPISRESSFVKFQFVSKVPYYYIILLFLILSVFIASKITKSRLGYYLRAIKEDEDAAKALGINPTKYKLIAFIISSVLAAFGGTYYAQLQLYIEPTDIASVKLGTQLIFITIIGGRGTVLGPAIGALIFVPLSEITRMYLSGTRIAGLDLIVLGAVVVFIMMYAPEGVVSLLRKVVTNKIERRID